MPNEPHRCAPNGEWRLDRLFSRERQHVRSTFHRDQGGGGVSIAQQALAAVAISQVEGSRIAKKVPRQRRTIATPEPALVPNAR